jgi:hypothetical protein
MARISLVGVGALSASTSSPQTPAIPRGTQSGDVMILTIQGRPSGTAGTNDAITPPSGWTQRGSRVRREVGTYDLTVETWWKVAGSGETAPSITAGSAFAPGGTVAGWSAFITTFRGVDTTTPFEANSQVTGNSAAAATLAPASYTTGNNNAMALSIVATSDDNNLGLDLGFVLLEDGLQTLLESGEALLLESGETTVAQGFMLAAGGTSYHTVTGEDHSVGLAIKEQATPGAVTQPTWRQNSNGNDLWVAISDALRPDSTSYAVEETWFNATNGSAWPSGSSGWSTAANPGAAVTTQNVRGRLTSGTVGSWGGWSRGAGGTDVSAGDFEARFTFVFGTIVNWEPPEWYAAFGFRADNDFSVDAYAATNGYWVEPYARLDKDEVFVVRKVGGTRTLLHTGSGMAGASGDHMHFRVRFEGTALKMRWWLNSAAEPSTWNYEVTDSSHSSGRFYFAINGGDDTTSDTLEVIHLRITNLAAGTDAPAEGASGTGSAYNTTISKLKSVSATLASGTGSAYNTTISKLKSVSATLASGTGTAYNTTISKLKSVSATLASGTGTSYNTTISKLKSVSATLASGTGSAHNTGKTVLLNSGHITGSGVANDISVESVNLNVSPEKRFGGVPFTLRTQAYVPIRRW